MRKIMWKILRISRLVLVVLQSERSYIYIYYIYNIQKKKPYIMLYILHKQNTHKRRGYRKKKRKPTQTKNKKKSKVVLYIRQALFLLNVI